MNKGDGTFAAGLKSRAGDISEPEGIDRADLDGDGDEDLAIAIDFERDERPGAGVKLNNGNGTFGFMTEYHVSEDSYFYDVLIEDFNGDGKHDIVLTGGSSGGAIYVFRGNGDGTLQPTPYVLTNDGAGWAITEADFDRDGDMDIAAVGGPGNRVSVFANAGNGTFGDQSTLHPSFAVGTQTSDLTRARMNTDTKPDLVVANAGSDNVSVLMNTTP